VAGIDASGVGVRQMLAEAEKQDVLVEGIVADIYAFAFTERYDVIVLDSFLHFARDKAKELKLLATLCQQLQEDGIICLFVHRSKSSERILKDFFTAYPSSWRVLMDDYLDYTYRDKASDFVSSFQYHSYIVQKELP
jgi:trans-aconitate methyltransferase